MNLYGLEELQVDPVEFALDHCADGGISYLTFGGIAGLFAGPLADAGGIGISVSAYIPDAMCTLPGHMQLIAPLHEDPRIIQLMDGTWRRSVTIDEIFTQFPGPYRFVAAVHTGMDRKIIGHKCVRACGPRVIVIGEDGHNEEIVEDRQRHGYFCRIAGDMLIMVRP